MTFDIPLLINKHVDRPISTDVNERTDRTRAGSTVVEVRRKGDFGLGAVSVVVVVVVVVVGDAATSS